MTAIDDKKADGVPPIALDPIALGNTVAMVLVLQRTLAVLAAMQCAKPSEFGALVASDVGRRIDALTLPAAYDAESMRTAAREMLAKIVEGVS